MRSAGGLAQASLKSPLLPWATEWVRFCACPLGVESLHHSPQGVPNISLTGLESQVFRGLILLVQEAQAGKPLVGLRPLTSWAEILQFNYSPSVCSVAQLCLALCGSMDCSPQGSFVHGIFPSKNTGVGCHFFLQGNLPYPGIVLEPFTSPALADGFFTTSSTWEALPLFVGLDYIMTPPLMVPYLRL